MMIAQVPEKRPIQLHAGPHRGISAPELLGAAIIGHHPDSMDKKISHPKNHKGDDDCENKAFGVHNRKQF